MVSLLRVDFEINSKCYSQPGSPSPDHTLQQDLEQYLPLYGRTLTVYEIPQVEQVLICEDVPPDIFLYDLEDELDVDEFEYEVDLPSLFPSL